MLWCDATNCVRPMPSCSILWVLKSHMEEDMPAGIAITNTDHTVDDIRALARKCNDSRQSRRLRAIAHLMEGELSRGMTALRAFQLDTVGSMHLKPYVRFHEDRPPTLRHRDG